MARTRRAAIYARLSVTTEESVSIERQVRAGRNYADARGWEVVLVATDDGVSATKNRPEDRVGWRTILDSPEPFDAVIVWKVDRLARRVLDFLHAHEALEARGCGIVAVEDPVDMTTAQGRAFATMLAVFGELEAAAISARVTAARRAIVHAGRRAGGRPPFGWMNVKNPEGPGQVLAKDPERIDVVEALARRALAGESLYSLARWLEAERVLPRERKGRAHPTFWRDASVETILRNPALAGLTPYRGDVLRDTDGLPIVDESVAILSTSEHRALLAILDARKATGTRSGRPAASLLSGIIRCGTCDRPLHRSTVAAKYAYYRCSNRECERPVGAPRASVEALVAERFLAAVGRLPALHREEVGSDPAPALAEVEAAIADTTARMSEDDADVPALVDRLQGLKALRERARAEATAAPEVRVTETGKSFREVWEADDDVARRHDLLASALEAVVVTPTDRRGNTLDPDRVVLQYREGPNLDARDGESPGVRGVAPG